MSLPPSYTQRQLAVPDWNQEAVATATCLVFGVGGVGTNILPTLARLGVKKIVMVDFDVVEETNLNRQVLFSPADIGKRKVDAAMHHLRTLHVLGGGTEIVGEHYDAVKEWRRTCGLVAAASVVFNGIDHGQGFDVAIGSLCRKHRIPYIAASTYAHTGIFEAFSNLSADHPCVGCSVGGPREMLQALHVDKIATLYDDLSDVIAMDEKPPTGTVGSWACVAAVGGALAVNAWVQIICGNDKNVGTWNQVDLARIGLEGGVTRFAIDRTPNGCGAC
eukprot:PhM_4_TR2049/c1_g1_i1/m.95544/K21029/moeB; molybdopterin-synthase adenylyltransferase